MALFLNTSAGGADTAAVGRLEVFQSGPMRPISDLVSSFGSPSSWEIPAPFSFTAREKEQHNIFDIPHTQSRETTNESKKTTRNSGTLSREPVQKVEDPASLLDRAKLVNLKHERRASSPD